MPDWNDPERHRDPDIWVLPRRRRPVRLIVAVLIFGVVAFAGATSGMWL